MISKKTREIIYNKYNGHCAYCGCEIPFKGFNVDHLHCIRNYEYTEEFNNMYYIPHALTHMLYNNLEKQKRYLE